MAEIWKDIKDFEGLYKISNKGLVIGYSRTWKSGMNLQIVKSCKERVINPCKTTNGYLNINLRRGGKSYSTYIHRLVAAAFIHNELNLPQVNHKDGNKLNNNIENLEWCTISENIKHAFRTGLKVPSEMILTKKYGIKNGNAKAIIQRDLEGLEIKKWQCVVYAADTLGFKAGNLANCACGRQKTAYNFKWQYI